MKALIDADIFCYEFGNMTDLDTGDLLAWEITRSLVDDRINSILSAVEATSSVFYLTDSKSNFRNEVATILPYKGHRPADKPPHWAAIRQHLIDNYDAQVQYGIEADDACGIEQFSTAVANGIGGEKDCWTTIICSRDKDLKMIPGWHYSWQCGKQQEKKWFVSEEDGIRFFYKQLLTGDATDNILGLYRVGEKASCVKALDSISDEYEMFQHVAMEYFKRFGYRSPEFIQENAELLWILREPVEYEGTQTRYPAQEINDRFDEFFQALEDEEEDECIRCTDSGGPLQETEDTTD